MKHILFIILFFIICSSCDEIESENCQCTPNLTCNDSYAGFWKATTTNNCDNVLDTYYTITINESEDCSITNIYNFLGDGEIISIEFKSQSIVIPSQQLDKDDNIFGTGFLENDTLRIMFTKKDIDFDWEDHCEMIAIKE